MTRAAVLVVGSGGREHAIVDALSRSTSVSAIFAAPGNPGIARHAELVKLDPADHAAVLAFVKEKKIDLTVIGPEAPLVAGLADALRKAGHAVMGAGREAAQLEGSKIYAKTFMARYGIPTAGFRVFDDATAAKAFARSDEGRTFRVMKADGLAAGKGVVVAKDTDELVQAIDDAMTGGAFGDAGRKILLEETLSGPEVSVIALTDGRTVLPFPAAQDHKRVFDDDGGPNTGGMGAYAPTPFYSDEVRDQVDRDVIRNFLSGLKGEGLDFRGVIYFGLMLTAKGPMVLEFNVRFGDPETEAILPLVQSDIYQAFLATAKGELANVSLKIRSGAACTVVMASNGYPGSFKTGLSITGAEDAFPSGRVTVFQAGTRRDGDELVTAGGRVLAVTGVGRTLYAAVVHAYQGVKRIHFDGAHFRTDIAGRAIRHGGIRERIVAMKERHAGGEA